MKPARRPSTRIRKRSASLSSLTSGGGGGRSLSRRPMPECSQTVAVPGPAGWRGRGNERMDAMTDFLVRRDDFRQSRIAESETPAVGEGQALLRVDSFGLTANNVTYAVMGEAMSYWDFFPAEEGWGRVPTWGFAEVEASEVDGVGPGTRVYGYLPPSSHLLVRPVSVSGGGFADGSPHRAKLPSAYHRYLSSGEDPF